MKKLNSHIFCHRILHLPPYLTTINKFPLKRMGILAIRIRLWLTVLSSPLTNQLKCTERLQQCNQASAISHFWTTCINTLKPKTELPTFCIAHTWAQLRFIYSCMYYNIRSLNSGLGCREKYVKNSRQNAKALEIKVLNTVLFSTPSQSSLDVFINCLTV